MPGPVSTSNCTSFIADTEAQKNSKKRRVKAIKQQQKTEQAEQQIANSAKSWQQFNKKVHLPTFKPLRTSTFSNDLYMVEGPCQNVCPSVRELYHAAAP